MKKYLYLLIVFTIMLAVVPVQANEVYTPVVEKIDLKVDGSVTPVTKSLTASFDYITHMIIEMDYDDAEWIGSEFGKGTALVNGTRVLYKGSLLFPSNITKNDHFYTYMPYVERFLDSKSPANVHMYAHLHFMDVFGFNLKVDALTDLQVIIQDDLTSATYDLLEFELYIHGYSLSSASGRHIDIEEEVLRYNIPIHVTFKGLTESTHYKVNWTNSDAGIDFWSDVDASDESMFLSMHGTEADDYQIIYLRDYDTGAIIDSVTLFYIDADYFDISDLFNAAPYVIGFSFVGLCLLWLPIYILRRAH